MILFEMIIHLIKNTVTFNLKATNQEERSKNDSHRALYSPRTIFQKLKFPNQHLLTGCYCRLLRCLFGNDENKGVLSCGQWPSTIHLFIHSANIAQI